MIHPANRRRRELAKVHRLLVPLTRSHAAAGIAKRDERGRVLDVHSLRHIFGTWLSAAGVSPRTAQAAMRHSDVNLTMGVYTDAKLMDGAVASLPTLTPNGVLSSVNGACHELSAATNAIASALATLQKDT